MKRWNIFLFAAVLLVLSACAPAKGATAVEVQPEAVAVTEVPAEARPDDAEPDVIAPPPDYPDLGIELAEPVRMEYREYFKYDREEIFVLKKWSGYCLMRGRDLPEDAAGNAEIDPAALYLYNEKAEPALRVCRLPVDGAVDDEPDGTLTYGHSLRRAYCLTDGGRTLTQINPATGEVRYVYRSDSALRILTCGKEIVVFAEQTGDDTCRTLRLFEPDGTVDVLEENMPRQMKLQVVSSGEFVTSWPNPKLMELYEAHPAELSGDDAVQRAWEDYGVPDSFVRYYNARTHYRRTMLYSSAEKRFFFPDGAECPARLGGNSTFVTEACRFEAYLAPDEETVPEEKKQVAVQHYETPLDLGLLPPETMSREEYFSKIRNEGWIDSKTDGWTYEFTNGVFLRTGRFIWLPELKDHALYFYRSGPSGMELTQQLLEIYEIPGSEHWSGYSCTLRRFYAMEENDETQLLQFNPETGASQVAYRSEGKIEDFRTGRNVVVISEQTADGTWRVVRLYEPDGSTDVLIDNLTRRPWIDGKSNCEFLIGWWNPEQSRLREAHKLDFWTEYWTGMTAEIREDAMASYVEAHPDYVDDGGVPPYDEELLPGCSGDIVSMWVWTHYGVPDWFEYYCNTLTGYHKTMAYSFYGFQYFFLDGTPWEGQSAAESTGNQWEGLAFWLYLPSDD